MFSTGSSEDARRAARNPARPAKEPGLSIVAAGTRICGQLDTDGVVKVEGTIVGCVRAERQVLVAQGGLVEGDILTREAIIGGEVRGAIYADDRVEIQGTSSIHGDITTQRIVVQEGGEVNGNMKMSNPEALTKQPDALPSVSNTWKSLPSRVVGHEEAPAQARVP